MIRRHLLQAAVLPAAIAAALWSSGALAQETVRIAYQTGADPAKVAQAEGVYEKATGRTIDWRKFDSGADVITAIASGDIQIGYVGSSPLAAAASRELPIETIFIAAELGTAEALVVRNGSNITKGTDLAGKKIAVPFVSTTHYSLLAALKHWKVDPSKVTILNLRPPEISAAWQRGDIDGAYVWDPALGQIKASGKVLTSSAEVAKWGAPTFDAWIVRKDFAEKYPDVVAQFVKVTGESYAAYNKDPKGFASKTNVDKIAKLTGAKPEEIPELLAGNKYPVLSEQATLLSGNTVKAVAETSKFLKEQQKIDKVLPDYKPYVSTRYVQAASSGTKLAAAKAVVATK